VCSSDLKRSEQARVTAAHTQISFFATGLDAFEVDVGRYPTNEEGMQALVEMPAQAAGWHGPYLSANTVPNDPWGHPYVYKCPGDHNTSGYDLLSLGPDGQAGTGDDIDNWSP
jgi:general secretion pathway protein G